MSSKPEINLKRKKGVNIHRQTSSQGIHCLCIISKLIPPLQPFLQSFHTRQYSVIRPEIPHRTNIIRENANLPNLLTFAPTSTRKALKSESHSPNSIGP